MLETGYPVGNLRHDVPLDQVHPGVDQPRPRASLFTEGRDFAVAGIHLYRPESTGVVHRGEGNGQSRVLRAMKPPHRVQVNLRKTVAVEHEHGRFRRQRRSEFQSTAGAGELLLHGVAQLQVDRG